MILTHNQTKLLGKLTDYMRSNPLPVESVLVLAAPFSKAHNLDLTDEEIEETKRKLLEDLEVSQDEDLSLQNSDTHHEWLQARQQSTKTPFWDAYAKELAEKSWPLPIIDALDTQTDEIVELMGDPQSLSGWPRKGLLMGAVQSGKTATYIGAMNKAIDYGYRLFVLIGGHTNDLRRQTQMRLDEDLIGRDTRAEGDHIHTPNKSNEIGVGKNNQRDIDVFSLTTADTDFVRSSKRASSISISENNVFVFVTKKNVSTLRSVRQYISNSFKNGSTDIPFVVIDDESDWGSPNTNDPDRNPTEVNKQIKELLKTSTRSSYLAVTATPFANVLINHSDSEDLFPSDYIRVLTPPNNYSGTEYFFQTENNNISTAVEDCLEVLPLSHKKTHIIQELPPSLKQAIRTFLIASANKWHRDSAETPVSMLIHISRFQDVQTQIHQLVVEYVEQLQNAVETELHRSNATSFSEHIIELQRIHDEDFSGNFLWEEIKESLSRVAHEVKTQLVNSTTRSERETEVLTGTKEELEELSLIPTIFVGGDVLSRGLTLNGLIVSYFVRQPSAADTLLQMARWFGYRDGYLDLIRIWLPQRTNELFQFTSEMLNDFKDELKRMKAFKYTPLEFGLKLRQIPEFAIVSAVKRRHAAVKQIGVNFHGETASTRILSLSQATREHNHAAVLGLLENLATKDKTNFRWDGIPYEEISNFLTDFRADRADEYFSTPPNRLQPQVVDIADRIAGHEDWSVIIVQGQGKQVQLPGKLGTVPSSIRNNLQPVASNSAVKFAHGALHSAHDMYNALQDATKSGLDKKLHDRQANKLLEQPTLFLYAVTADSAENNLQPITEDLPLWAVRVAFPGLTPLEEERWLRGGEKPQTVLVNSVFLDLAYGSPEDEADYDESDE